MKDTDPDPPEGHRRNHAGPPAVHGAAAPATSLCRDIHLDPGTIVPDILHQKLTQLTVPPLPADYRLPE